MSYELPSREVTCPLCRKPVRLQKFYVHGFACPGRHAGPAQPDLIPERGRQVLERPQAKAEEPEQAPVPEKESVSSRPGLS